MAWLKENKEEKSLPGLSQFTPRQLFWISSAQYKCSKLSDQKLRDQIRFGQNAPWSMRNNGSVMSSPEFSIDFSCPVGSPMNPDWSAEKGCLAKGMLVSKGIRNVLELYDIIMIYFELI